MSQPMTMNGNNQPQYDNVPNKLPEQQQHGRQASPPANPQQQQPQVRHIPIFVEGRDEPLINRNIDTSSSGPTHHPTSEIPLRSSPPQFHHYHHESSPPTQQQKPPNNQHQQNQQAKPKTQSLFDRVKNFPIRVGETVANNVGPRAATPAPDIPAKVMNQQHATASPNVHQQATPIEVQPPPAPQQQQQPQPPPPQPPQSVEPIARIQKIQREVLSLMDQVEGFEGSSRRDKQYLYLDEMFTQNLLKLDTIDADGKENIKQARRAAIKCINHCISVLEAKADQNSMNGVADNRKNSTSSRSSSYDNVQKAD